MGNLQSKNFVVKKVILSRGRFDTISTHKLIPSASIIVPKSELIKYRKSCPDSDIQTIPDRYRGLSMVRNWVLDHIPDKKILMLDDDIIKLFCICRLTGFDITDPSSIDQVIENAANCCDDAKAKVFGFNQAWDVRRYRENKPFKLWGWVGAAVGIVGRGIRFDENNKLRVDVDYCLQSLLEDRIIWIDNRFSFVQSRFSNTGGNAKYRTMESDLKEREYLQNKWGRYLKFSKTKIGYTIKTNVERCDHPDKIK